MGYPWFGRLWWSELQQRVRHARGETQHRYHALRAEEGGSSGDEQPRGSPDAGLRPTGQRLHAALGPFGDRQCQHGDNTDTKENRQMRKLKTITGSAIILLEME